MILCIKIIVSDIISYNITAYIITKYNGLGIAQLSELTPKPVAESYQNAPRGCISTPASTAVPPVFQPEHSSPRRAPTEFEASQTAFCSQSPSLIMAAAAVATTRRPSGPVLSAAHYRSASPTRVTLARSAGPPVSVSSSSPAGGARSRRSCMCSPTNHPGSFRCSLHKERNAPGGGRAHHNKPTSPGGTSSRLGASASRRMGSALARIGAVEGGEWARRALAARGRVQAASEQALRHVHGRRQPIDADMSSDSTRISGMYVREIAHFFLFFFVKLELRSGSVMEWDNPWSAKLSCLCTYTTLPQTANEPDENETCCFAPKQRRPPPPTHDPTTAFVPGFAPAGFIARTELALLRGRIGSTLLINPSLTY
jgi:hypothetical protein